MKLSIAWIFSHINADWKKIDIKNLVDRFNKTTAEIETFRKVDIDLNNLFAAKIANMESENVILHCAEIKKDIEIPKRQDVKNFNRDQVYLVKKNENNSFDWAKSVDFGAEKFMNLPAVDIKEDLIAGRWKDSFEAQDYIIEIDNKSITHRPDLWGHRGIAREIAAIFDFELLPIDKFIIKKDIISFENESKPTSSNPFYSKIENSNLCKRFATIFIKEVESKASDLEITARLSRIDLRAINAIVDATNYVMLDLSQPMHAFDAQKINTKILSPKLAESDQKLKLLDDNLIELSQTDLIISDGTKPVALAGIMGGKDTQVDDQTKDLIIESACFDASIIRRSSIKYKERTEASARFEKSLDPNQNTVAIERFLKILDNCNINIKQASEIISLGKEAKELVINVEHTFIEKKLGVKLSSDFIVKTLKKLDFKIRDSYSITVPTFRSTKDITIPEDIVEEVGRFFGYENIPFVLPLKQMVPSDLMRVTKIRKLKQLMATATSSHEVQNYPFYDESFLSELKWSPDNAISVMSPVSQNWKRLVTSLIPHLLKDVQQNLGKLDELNFFELNRTWIIESNNPVERNFLSGIFFNHKKNVDFYNSKAQIEKLFELLKINVNWSKGETEGNFIWFSKYQTADLLYNGKKIGTAGKIAQEFLNKIAQGDAFIFEIDANFLLDFNPDSTKFKPLSKYPAVWLDISLFVPLSITVEQIINIIKKVDSRIYKVELIDIFEKDDWINKKSLAFRYHFVDEHKTLLKEEIDQIANKVNKSVEQIGAVLR